MRFLDETKKDAIVEGRISWLEVLPNGEHKLIYQQNKVLTGARTIMRDLLAGDNQTIAKCLIGDCNIGLSGDMNTSPDQPDVSDTELTHKITEVEVESVEKKENAGRPSVLLTFKLPAGDNMGTDTGEFVIAEIGLVRDDELMFAKATHKPIIKRPFSGFVLQWEILF